MEYGVVACTGVGAQVLCGPRMADLDDLLDDIEIEGGGDEAPAQKIVNWEEEIQSPGYQAWVEAASGVPEDMRNRWSELMVKDLSTELKPALQMSELYRSWENQPPNHQSTGKILQEAVRNACLKCGFNEKKTTALLSLTNALEEGPGKALQAAYRNQILKDLKSTCLADRNFDAARFPNLARSFQE